MTLLCWHSEAAAMHAVSEMEVAVSELAPLHEAITSLGSEVLLPMRTLELDAAQTASRYAESLAEANARAISEQSASCCLLCSRAGVEGGACCDAQG